MATYREGKIVSFSDYLGPKTSPSDSPPTQAEPPDRNPGGQVRLVMKRFFVRRFYRRRDRGGYWYARVQDLKTGKILRVSTGKRNLKKADKALTLKLRVVEQAVSEDEQAAEPNPYADELMDKVVRELTGKDPAPRTKLVAEWVKDENYAFMTQALKETLRLVDRGKNAITPADLERGLQKVIGQSPEREGPFFEVAFEKHLKTKDVRPSTLQGYEETGRLFQRFLKRKHVHAITGLDIQQFIDSFKHEGKSQRTRQKHLNCLRSFFRWARDVARYVQEDPTAGIKVRVLRRERKKKRKGLTLEEARRFLAACRLKRRQRRHDIQHVWMATFISLRTGLRLDNVLALTWSRVDLELGFIHVPPDLYKTDRGDDLKIPLHAELWRVLRLWKQVRKTSPLVTDADFVLGKRVKQIIGPFINAAKRAGIETDFHNLRHAFETWLTEWEAPGPVQSALLGHSPGSVTEGYAHPSIEKMRECVNRLPRLLGHRE